MQTFKDIDSYISEQAVDVRDRLEQIRQVVKTSAPKAEEVISYGMPAFKYHGMLVYFAAFKNHIGFYALPSGNEAFQKELSVYKQGKGSIQFPLDKPIPLTLIKKIVKFRVKENIEKVGIKKQSKK
ncbi:MAG: DUF1801 domain-containing protein [Bacteroidetes bacterium]|nr:DUF1801 domain-containing protein [Bacteroidota bacterium]